VGRRSDASRNAVAAAHLLRWTDASGQQTHVPGTSGEAEQRRQRG
jgi:hypothetical protein